MLRSIQRYTASACVVLGLVSGCGSSGGSPEVIAGGAQTSARPPLDPVVPGYVHTLDRSRFKIGKAPTLELSSPLLQRWRGSFGAFAVDPTNGLAMGVLDHDAPAGPYMLDAAGQSAKVKAYFIAAGATRPAADFRRSASCNRSIAASHSRTTAPKAVNRSAQRSKPSGQGFRPCCRSSAGKA